MNTIQTNKTSLIVATLLTGIALLFFSIGTIADKAPAPPTSSAALHAELQTLLNQHSARELIQHIEMQLQAEDWQTLGQALTVLRHGKKLDQSAIDYLSTKSNSDYRAASDIGKWLGAARLALETTPNDPKGASDGIKTLLASMDDYLDEHQSSGDYLKSYSSLLADISSKHLDTAAALELIAYGDIQASDITTPIGNATQKVLRNR